MSTIAHALAATAAVRTPVEPRTAVETRFGAFVFDETNTLFMPSGPLGFASHRHFGLANLPAPKLSAFKLLQSLDDAEVSFIVTPLDLHEAPIEMADLEAGARAAGMALEEVETLGIVTVRSGGPSPELTVNLRAPVLVDLRLRLARQVVLNNPDLPIRHPIGAPA